MTMLVMLMVIAVIIIIIVVIVIVAIVSNAINTITVITVTIIGVDMHVRAKSRQQQFHPIPPDFTQHQLQHTNASSESIFLVANRQ